MKSSILTINCPRSLWILRFFPFLFALLSLSGQTTPNPLQTEFRAVSWQRPISEPLYVRSNGSMVPLQIHNMMRSQPVEYKGDNPIEFFRKSKGPDGSPVYTPVASVQMDPTLASPLLFFVENDGKYQVMTLEDSFEDYPVGSYRFYNFTDNDLLARLGDEKINLKPKNTVYLKEPFRSDQRYPVAFVVREPDGIHPLYTNMWSHSQNYRYLVLVSRSDSNDLSPIQFHILSDYPR